MSRVAVIIPAAGKSERVGLKTPKPFLLLAGVPVLIIDSLRPSPHPTHMTLDEALATAEQLSAGTVWLTHFGHENDHAHLESILPDHIRPAYDGLALRFEPPS